MLAESVVLELCRSGALGENVEIVNAALAARRDALVEALRERLPRRSSSSPRAATSSGSTSLRTTTPSARSARPRKRASPSSPAPTSCSRAAARACASLSRASRSSRSPRASIASPARSNRCAPPAPPERDSDREIALHPRVIGDPLRVCALPPWAPGRSPRLRDTMRSLNERRNRASETPRLKETQNEQEHHPPHRRRRHRRPRPGDPGDLPRPRRPRRSRSSPRRAASSATSTRPTTSARRAPGHPLQGEGPASRSRSAPTSPSPTATHALARFLPALGASRAAHSTRASAVRSRGLWHKAAKDPLFQAAQETLRDTLYFNPSVELAKADGSMPSASSPTTTRPSCMGSGMNSVRDRALAVAATPTAGGDEVAYLSRSSSMSVSSRCTRTPKHRNVTRIETAQRRFLHEGNLDLHLPLAGRSTATRSDHRLRAAHLNTPERSRARGSDPGPALCGSILAAA